MRSTKTVHVISAHAEGEVGDVIVGGVAPPPRTGSGKTEEHLANASEAHFHPEVGF